MDCIFGCLEWARRPWRPNSPYRTRLGSAEFRAAVVVFTLLSMASFVYVFRHVVQQMQILDRHSYGWELQVEYALVSAYVLPIHDGILMYGMWRWRHQQQLDWKGHHVTAAVFTTSLVRAPFLLFFHTM
jgi:hypothetical protein